MRAEAWNQALVLAGQRAWSRPLLGWSTDRVVDGRSARWWVLPTFYLLVGLFKAELFTRVLVSTASISSRSYQNDTNMVHSGVPSTGVWPLAAAASAPRALEGSSGQRSGTWDVLRSAE